MKIYTEGGELAVEYKYDAWGAIVDISYSSAYEKIAKANCLLYRGYYYDFDVYRNCVPEKIKEITADIRGVNSNK